MRRKTLPPFVPNYYIRLGEARARALFIDYSFLKEHSSIRFRSSNSSQCSNVPSARASPSRQTTALRRHWSNTVVATKCPFWADFWSDAYCPPHYHSTLGGRPPSARVTLCLRSVPISEIWRNRPSIKLLLKH